MTDFKVDGHSFRILEDSIVATSHYTLHEGITTLVARELIGRTELDGFTVEVERPPYHIVHILRGVVNADVQKLVKLRVDVSLWAPDSHFITFGGDSFAVCTRELEDGTFQIGSSEFKGIVMRFRDLAEGRQ